MAIAVVVAGGRGERLGHDRPKALVPLAGRPLVSWALGTLIGVPGLRRIVVVLPAGEALPDDPTAWGLQPGAWDAASGQGPAVASNDPSSTGPPGWRTSPAAGGGRPRVIAVPGGRERSHSVREGLRAAGSGPADEAILVHDGARPLLTAGLVEACLRAVAAGADAAIAAAPVTDTVKQAGAPTDTGLARVERTLDRSRLWAVQTPQAFRRAALTAALDRPEPELAAATDDASLVEADGGDVRLVPAPRSNLKVTVPEDLRLAELLLGTHRRPGERAEPPSAARQSGPC